MRAGWNEVALNGRRQWVCIEVRIARRSCSSYTAARCLGVAQRRRYLRHLERDWPLSTGTSQASADPTAGTKRRRTFPSTHKPTTVRRLWNS